MGITTYRQPYKPFEYEGVMPFVKAIQKQFWVHDEVPFTADILEYDTELDDIKRSYVKRALLGISQIEVDVKMMWQNIYTLFPKPEINGLGATFGESEFRHSEAYSRLGDVLNYNDELASILEVPQFKRLVDFLKRHLGSNDPFDKLGVFALLVENGLLFGMFAIPYSLTRFEGTMKNISNIIAWTSVDEEIHAQAGIYLLNILQSENPLTEYERLIKQERYHAILKEFIEIETDLLKWVFELGDSTYISQTNILNFVKRRLDNGLTAIGFDSVFNITDEEYAPMKWFDEEVFADTLDDFFAKRPVDYTKHDKPITSDDLY